MTCGPRAQLQYKETFYWLGIKRTANDFSLISVLTTSRYNYHLWTVIRNTRERHNWLEEYE